MSKLAKKLSEMSKKELIDVIIMQGIEIQALKDTDIFEKELEDRTKLCCALADKDVEIESLRSQLAEATAAWYDRDNRLIASEAQLSEAEALLRDIRAHADPFTRNAIDAHLSRKNE